MHQSSSWSFQSKTSSFFYFVFLLKQNSIVFFLSLFSFLSYALTLFFTLSLSFIQLNSTSYKNIVLKQIVLFKKLKLYENNIKYLKYSSLFLLYYKLIINDNHQQKLKQKKCYSNYKCFAQRYKSQIYNEIASIISVKKIFFYIIFWKEERNESIPSIHYWALISIYIFSFYLLFLIFKRMK